MREQLDALFAHRVYFATASARDARAAAALTMAEFSDSVRPGLEASVHASANPTCACTCPSHHAIASRVTTPWGGSPVHRQTIPLDGRSRAAGIAPRHASATRWTPARRSAASRIGPAGRPGRTALTSATPQRQAASPRSRGDAGDTCRTPRVGPGVASAEPAGSARADPPDRAVGEQRRYAASRRPAESYRELVGARPREQGVRWAAIEVARVKLRARCRSTRGAGADRADSRHVLTSQMHRRFNRRAGHNDHATRLKRLSDAGLLERLQFHRRDGGGDPDVLRITAAGLRILERARSSAAPTAVSRRPVSERGADGVSAIDVRANANEGRLRQARHDVMWPAGRSRCAPPRTPPAICMGREQSVISPPRGHRPTAGSRSLGRRSAPAGRPDAARLPAQRRRRVGAGSGALRDGASARDRRAGRGPDARRST